MLTYSNKDNKLHSVFLTYRLRRLCNDCFSNTLTRQEQNLQRLTYCICRDILKPLCRNSPCTIQIMTFRALTFCPTMIFVLRADCLSASPTPQYLLMPCFSCKIFLYFAFLGRIAKRRLQQKHFEEPSLMYTSQFLQRL